MKTTRKVLSVLLAVVMVMLAVPVMPVVQAAAPEFDYSSMGAADGTGSADDLSNGGTQFGIIQFGAYPQTRETDDATIAALNSRASDWQSYGYYSGTGSYWDGQMTAMDYMQYCDVKCGGNKYRGVTFSQYRPNYTGYTSSANYRDCNGYTAGTTYWFKYEPLQWKVLDPSEGLVMCVSLIDSQPYNNYILCCHTDPPDPRGNAAYWGDAGKNHYANDYENSSLRKWLNETFYATAFTESQQSRIAKNHNHQNNDGYCTLTGNTNYTDFDSNPTNNKIFLLSYAEVLNTSYGFSSSDSSDTARLAQGTDYAKCQGLYVVSGSSYNGNHYSLWWLRSPGYYSYYACRVSSGGYAHDSSNVSFTDHGVRPACVISNLSSGGNTPEDENTPHFPDGYDFLEDSYGFVNDLVDVDISQKYFDGIFEAGTASLAHDEYHQAGALCYGMAFTTASIYNGFPDVSLWAFRKNLWTPELATKIRDLKRDTWWGKQSAAYIGGDFSDCVTLLDFIKYAFIYQYSVEAVQKLENCSNSALELLSLVKDYTDADQFGIGVGFTQLEGHEDALGGHEVLAIGYEGNDILIDNPNNADDYERLTVHEDGSWEFGGYNSGTHKLDWDLATHRPFAVLNSGNRVTASVDSDDDSTEERYMMGTEKLNTDYNLVSISSSKFDLKNSNYVTLPKDIKAGNSEQLPHTMLWIKEGDLELDCLADADNTVTCAGDNTVITTTTGLNSSVKINVQTKEANVSVKPGQEATLCFTTVLEGDTEDKEIKQEVVGVSNSDQITATQSDTGITVTGLNDMTITYSENDEVVSETTANVKDGREVNITVDEEKNTVQTDFVSHTPGDINGDGAVNNKDLNRLMKHLAGENVQFVQAALDVNGDGAVNNKDLNRLMKHLAGENVELH